MMIAFSEDGCIVHVQVLFVAVLMLQSLCQLCLRGNRLHHIREARILDDDL